MSGLARLAPLGSMLPGAALTVATILPVAGDVLRPVVGGFVAALSFAAIASMDTAPPTRREAGLALLMAAVPWGTGLVVLAGLSAAGLPPDLTTAAALAATAPVSLGTAARCHRLGLDARPTIWAALAGMALAPLLMPLMVAAALAGPLGFMPGLVLAWSLAERSLSLVAIPAGLGFVLRRIAPGAVRMYSPDLRGLCVAALTGLGLCGGAALSRSLPGLTWATFGLPLVLALSVQAVATALACLAAGLGPRRPGAAPTHGVMSLLLVASTSRNASLGWAAAGVLTPRAETVLAFGLAITFIVPAAIVAWSTHHRGPATAGRHA